MSKKTNIPRKDLFERNKKKKKKMSKFFRKTLRSNLKAFSQHQNRIHYVLFEHFIHAFNQNSFFISSIQNVSLKKIETAFLQNIFTSYTYIKLNEFQQLLSTKICRPKKKKNEENNSNC